MGQLPTHQILHRSPGAKCLSNRSDRGFTVIEALIVVMLIAILSAIAIPSWLSFLNILRLNSTQDQVYRAIRDAQSNAKRDKVTWQTSFQEVNVGGENVIQWAVHPARVSPTAARWNNMQPNIKLDDETTLARVASVRRVQFDYRGHVILDPTQNLGLGRITLSIPDGSSAKRCVFVSTYLGTLRSAQDHSNPTIESGRIYYCY